MSHKILKILNRSGKKISCIIDGEIIKEMSSERIGKMLEYIKELGSIRKAIAFFSSKLEESEYKSLLENGIYPQVVSADKDIYITIEGMHDAWRGEIDIIAIGIDEENMLPTLIKIREKKEVLVIIRKEELKSKILPYVDYLLVTKDLE